jgi:hypothetical protein
VLGKKSAPTSQPCCLYQLLALAAGQMFCEKQLRKTSCNKIIVKYFFIVTLFLTQRSKGAKPQRSLASYVFNFAPLR